MMPDVFATMARLADEARAELAAYRLRAETAEIALADARDEIERLRAPPPVEPAPSIANNKPSCEHMHTSALATVQCQMPPVHRGQCYAKHDLGAVAWWGRNPQP